MKNNLEINRVAASLESITFLSDGVHNCSKKCNSFNTNTFG
jgi:hypothetical protein